MDLSNVDWLARTTCRKIENTLDFASADWIVQRNLCSKRSSSRKMWKYKCHKWIMNWKCMEFYLCYLNEKINNAKQWREEIQKIDYPLEITISDRMFKWNVCSKFMKRRYSVTHDERFVVDCWRSPTKGWSEIHARHSATTITIRSNARYWHEYNIGKKI